VITRVIKSHHSRRCRHYEKAFTVRERERERERGGGGGGRERERAGEDNRADSLGGRESRDVLRYDVEIS
jgi:hypothetical protein